MSASLPYCEYNYPNLVGRARGRTSITSSQLMIDEPKKASAPSALDPTLRRGTITGHRHHPWTNSEPSLQTAAEIVTRVRIKRIRFYRNSQDDIYPSPCTSSEFSFKYYCNALHRISTEFSPNLQHSCLLRSPTATEPLTSGWSMRRSSKGWNRSVRHKRGQQITHKSGMAWKSNRANRLNYEFIRYYSTW